MLGTADEKVLEETGIESERSGRERERDPGCALGNKCTIKCPKAIEKAIREEVKGNRKISCILLEGQ